MERAAKRLLDVSLALSGLIAAAPVMLVIAVAIRATMGSPVLFRQVRPGYRAHPFELIKFRTMREAAGPDGRPLPGYERVTGLGYRLRKTSLDELPELWNVLKGEMSLVGPRPLLTEYLPRYSAEQARRHEVRPGLTGLAQINGRHLLDWKDRFDYDVWYVDHWSLRLDLKILRATVKVVILGSGLPPRMAEDNEFIGPGHFTDPGDEPS